MDTTELAYLQALVQDQEYCTIRFGYKGDWFQFKRNGTEFDYVKSLLGTTSPPGSTPGLPFQIYRMPRLTGSARDMPAGTAIDLTHSGVGASGYEFASAAQSVLLMFSPGGSVDSVLYVDSSGNPQTPSSGTVHFLVGRSDKTGTSGANSNLADPTSIWVSVGRLTGIVSSSENQPDDPNSTTDDPNNPTLAVARAIATNREQMGGR